MQLLKKLPPLPKLNLSRLLGIVDQNKSTIIIVGAIAAITINLVLQPIALRLDFSKNKAHTISPSSKNILRNLDQPAKLTLYESADLPSQLLPIKQDIHDLLNEYKREAGGKIVFEIKDPKLDEKGRQEAIQAGINEIQFSQMGQNQLNVSTGYFGLLLKVGEQTRAIPQLSDVENLEYNITSALFTMTRKEAPKVAVLGSLPAVELPQGADPLGLIKELLSQQFTVEPLEFNPTSSSPAGEEGEPTPVDNKEIDASIKTVLLFADQNKTYTDEEISRLKKYISNKGKLIVFLDGMGINEQFLATEEAKHNLFGFTESYGITVNKDLLLSTTAEVVNFGDQVQSLFIPYPYWFKANAFKRETGFFSNVNFVSFPWTSSITTKDLDGYTVTELITTDPKSWRETGPFVLDPKLVGTIQPREFSKYVVGAIASNQNGGTLMVIPSSRFGNPQFLSRESGNINFILNAVNNYASDGELSGIRQRSVQLYPLPSMSNSMKDIFKYANMVLLPAIFALGGAFYLLKRK